MKRVAAIIILTLVVFSSTAFAWVNLALTAAELAAPFVVSGAVKYFLPTSSTVNVPSYGRADSTSITRNSVGVRNGVAMAVTLGLGVLAVREALKIYGSDYPGLLSVSTSTRFATTGDVVTVGTKHYQIGSYLSESYLTYQVPYMIDGPRIYVFNGSSPNPASPYAYRVYSYTVVSAPDTVLTSDSTPSQIATSITDSSGNILPAYQPEIDSLIMSHPGLVSMPNSAVTANALSASSAGVSSSLASSVTSAKDARDTAQRIYFSNPSDENLKKLQDAEKALQDATAALEKNNQDNIKDEEDENLSPSSPDSLKSFDWSAFTRLKGVMADTWPFSLLSSIPDKLSLLVREPTAPVFVLPVYGNEMRVDLSIFDPVAAVCRWGVGLLLTVGCAFFLVKFWRGVS